MSRQEFSGIVSVQQETTFLGSGTLTGAKSISSATDLCVGVSNLEGRASLTISVRPDFDGYLGVFLSGQTYGLYLNAGQTVSLKLDKNINVLIRGVALGGTGGTVGIIEGKN